MESHQMTWTVPTTWQEQELEEEKKGGRRRDDSE
jgi:hypothetical protein